MSTPNVLPDTVQTADPNVNLKGPNVVVEGVDPKLMEAVKHFAALHRDLFSLPLVITSGRDGEHVAGSAHLRGKAVDVRSSDLTEAEQVVFTVALAYLARQYEVGVFDERGLLTAPHWHLEVAMYGS